jgi:HK97 family phage prohead protease
MNANRLYERHNGLIVRRVGGGAQPYLHVGKAPSTTDGARATFVVSAPGVDRTGSEILQSGWKLDGYKRNPVVLWAHGEGQERLPVGRTTNIGVHNDRLVATMQFASTKMARGVMELLQKGFLRGASAGFIPLQQSLRKDGTRVISTAELIEWSLCPIPAHPACLLQSITTGDGKSVDMAAKAARAETIALLKASPKQRRRLEIAALRYGL